MVTLGCITEKETLNHFSPMTSWREIFSLDSSKVSKAIFLYAEGALGCITEKNLKSFFSDDFLARDFFVRQFKGLEGYILICRGSFGLYNGKRSAKKKKNSPQSY